MKLKNLPGKTSKYLQDIMKSYDGSAGTNFIDERRLPDVQGIQEVLDGLMEILFPGYSGKRDITSENAMYVLGDLLTSVKWKLEEQLLKAFRHECDIESCPHPNCELRSERVIDKLFSELPEIRRVLKTDVQAAFDGDPAAKSEEEVVISYPGLRAMAIHRISHVLYILLVPLIPRMMNEIAHSQTGIDIHPGAKIGESVFIDHGTGVVIGETSIIGRNVKIYQGVTLGALSFPKDACGNLIRGVQRHPTIDDNVTIYAHATILGNVHIGNNSIIGSNVWLKDDVGPDTMVMLQNPKTIFRERKSSEKDKKNASEKSGDCDEKKS